MKLGDKFNTESENSEKPLASASAKEVFEKVKQLELDDILDKKDGKIHRPRDPKMCRHGEKAMCEFCMPLEPFDTTYQEEHKIKHLSFHAYLAKLNTQSNSSNKSTGASYVAPLTEPDYSVMKNCPSGHPSWPAGICSKCQPSAITLQRQEFRMVDHVEFSSSGIVNTFIDAWRQSGNQRIGYLYGHYEEYDSVPLGIKAVVEAIYEPPQQDERDGVILTLPWEEEVRIDKVASFCGLQKVGVIFTDLLDAGTGDSSVVCKRHIDSYFLSSLEICFAAEMQRRNPNPSRWSMSGQYSSKFVTCVISGNVNNEIDIASYQVSLSAEAMIKADLIEPSVNPSYMRVKEPSETRYVPDVFYTKINEYKRKVQENAKPAFPVEYLLVTLTHGFPESSYPMFLSDNENFTIENRSYLGQSQDLEALSRQLGISRNNSNDMDIPAEKISNFHMLCYIASMEILSENEIKLLCKYAVSPSPEVASELKASPGWATLKTIIRESI